ncbi:MAG: ATP cone domain-containing protein [Actinobacteria bacterium]|nr:ATP cone domain-containing protein [Actinomycetota bacterium]
MLNVVKATGEIEPFSQDKVISSINRAGITGAEQNKILDHVKSKLYDNIPTSEIYSHVNEFFEQSQDYFNKSKYSLKQSIMTLGPTGYPFEDFFAKLLEAEGYATSVRQILQGACVSHEIDIVAEKENKKIMIETKFHNLPGTRTDIHVALYTKARFDDIKEKNNFNEVWLATNTKATIDAINYGACVGMKIISWSYPEEGNLRDLVEKHKLFPITALSYVSQAQKQTLMDNHTILCSDINEDKNCLRSEELPEEKKDLIVSEANSLTKS